MQDGAQIHMAGIDEKASKRNWAKSPSSCSILPLF